MGKLTKKIIETVPNPEIDLKKNYKRIRIINTLTKRGLFTKKSDNISNFTINTNDGKVPVRFFYPTNKPKQIIIYYHGGGWVLGSVDSYTDICLNLAMKTSSIVISVDYRLAPENKFPCGFNDCYEVTEYVFKHARKFKIPRRRIYLMGDSAGGNFAACISLKRRDERKYIPKKQILLYPATASTRCPSDFNSVSEHRKNLSLSLKQLESYSMLYQVSKEDLANPYFAPLNSINLRKQPNTLVFVAELDILRDEGIEFAEKLYDAKNKVTLYRMEAEAHGYFTAFANTKAIRKTINLINKFIKE